MATQSRAKEGTRRISAPRGPRGYAHPGEGQAPPASPLPPARSPELGQPAHPSALRPGGPQSWRPRRFEPSIPRSDCPTMLESAYRLRRTQIRGDSNRLADRCSPRNPGSGGEEKEGCFRQYYIRGARLHHPEGDYGGRHEGRKWLHSYPKDCRSGRMYTFSRGSLCRK